MKMFYDYIFLKIVLLLINKIISIEIIILSKKIHINSTL